MKTGQVKLITGGGEFVCRGRIPVFNEAPRILVWGQRFFAYDGFSGEEYVYKEAFAVALLDVEQ